MSDSDVFLADCPARTTLRLVADTWAVVVVFGLGPGPLRHNDLLDRIGGISKKVLTQTLRKLEANGLVARRRLGTAPPGVEYRLTPLGRSLLGPVSALARWAEEHADELAGDPADDPADNPAGDPVEEPVRG
ncbi:winged helix-turn-helix transcriptional regulator [Saccharothrix hoggarensis]|uniref:Winged helix-turn-helix transcriptional regulator n=1 Tax=Saccharothrix hoggarensis TaxID=913853 RepID=A0ABW3R5R9_9PSEU